MNIALLTAGGVGNRMGNDIPKQFMLIDDAPVIIYTLKAFQNCSSIDAICVVCLDGWASTLLEQAERFGISKLKWVFAGGASNQESICKGMNGLLQAGCSEDDIILVHDGVRPLVSERIICENIAACKEYGYAVTGLVCKEAIMRADAQSRLHGIEYEREELIRTQTPHTYRLGFLHSLHEKAKKEGVSGTVASCTLAARLGTNDQHLVQGSELNGLKLTRPEDVELFKAMLAINPSFRI